MKRILILSGILVSAQWVYSAEKTLEKLETKTEVETKKDAEESLNKGVKIYTM